MLETLDYAVGIGNTPTILYFGIYIYIYKLFLLQMYDTLIQTQLGLRVVPVFQKVARQRWKQTFYANT